MSSSVTTHASSTSTVDNYTVLAALDKDPRKSVFDWKVGPLYRSYTSQDSVQSRKEILGTSDKG